MAIQRRPENNSALNALCRTVPDVLQMRQLIPLVCVFPRFSSVVGDGDMPSPIGAERRQETRTLRGTARIALAPVDFDRAIVLVLPA